MVNRTHERLIPVTKVPEYLENQTGKRVSLQTIYRWIRIGLHGIQLEAIYIGNVRMTSSEALERFDAEITRAKEAARKPARTAATTRQIRSASELARRRLNIPS